MDDAFNQKPKILAVDDEEFNLEIIEEALGDDFDLFFVRSGEACLEFIENTHPDAILMDANMPGINGFETCRLLKENPKTKHIPVIFVTALGLTEERDLGFSVGGAAYITKPFDLDTIIDLINSVLIEHSS